MDQYWIKTDKLNKFLRPEDKDDVRYRKLKKMNFESELKNVLPEDCNLCFHGTTIWNAEKILESGEISSRMDREGYDSELTNSPSVISVTTLNNVWFTIKNFADLHNYKYPAGCIFVLEASQEELVSARERNEIPNVDLIDSPDKLRAIITTPENIDRVRLWLQESPINCSEGVVMDYDEVLEYFSSQYSKVIDK